MDGPTLEAGLRREALFDPDAGITIAIADGIGPGHWAGAPGATVVDGDVVLTYRLRAPAPERGHTLVIARSADGVRFEIVRRIHRDDLAALSIERSAIVRADGVWRLLISFAAAEDRRWRIEAVEGPTLEGLDPRSRRPVLVAAEIGVAGVKDPWLRHVGGTWHLFTSFGLLPAGAGPELHVTGDALSTGRTGSLSGLATSRHGISWHWRGAVLEPSPGRWDGYTARLTTALRSADGWIGLYDGGTLEGNYEERCGLAFSEDLLRWRKTARNGPAVGSASGPGGVRYVDIVEMPSGDRRAYYEWTRPDGSHELRTAPVRSR